MRAGILLLCLATLAGGEEPEEGRKPVPFEWRQLGGSAAHADTRQQKDAVIVPKVLWHAPEAVGQPTSLGGWLYCGGPALGRIKASTGTFERSPLADDRRVAPTPVLTGDRVIVRRPEGKVEAYTHDLRKRIWQSDTGTPGPHFAFPAAWHGRLLVVGAHREVVALRIQDGKIQWRFSTEGRDIGVTPAISDGRVFFGSLTGGVWGLDLNSGKQLWYLPGRGMYRYSNPVVSGNDLIIVDHGIQHGEKPHRTGQLHVIDVARGVPRWSSEPTGKSWFSTPCVARGRIVLGTFETVLQFDVKTGKALAPRIEIDDLAFGKPAIVEDTLYFGTVGGFLHARDLRTGALKWRLRIPGEQEGKLPHHVRSIVHTGTRIYVETTNGLYCVVQDPNRRGVRPQNLTITAPD